VDDEGVNETSQTGYSSTTIQHELRLLALSAGIGASLDLSNLTDEEAFKVVNALKYPKAHLSVQWQRSGKLFSNLSDLHGYKIVCLLDLTLGAYLNLFLNNSILGGLQYQRRAFTYACC
jgi:hypothetical protein